MAPAAQATLTTPPPGRSEGIVLSSVDLPPHEYPIPDTGLTIRTPGDFEQEALMRGNGDSTDPYGDDGRFF